MIACTCKDYDLYILNIEDGTQLCCPIVLDDHLVELKLNLNYLLAITCNGFLYVWYYDDYEHLVKIFINRQSCFSIFKGKTTFFSSKKCVYLYEMIFFKF